MALTLIEAAKRNSGDVIKQAVIEIYAKNSDILRVLPFENIAGNALKYNQEQALPGVGFRGVNEGYTESTGILNPVTEALAIAGGDIDVDIFIDKTQGSDQRAVQESMKIKALALSFTKTFIKGDSEAISKEFDGLQVRIVGDQLIDAGATSGGDALSLGKLDEMIDQVDDPNYLIMNKTMRRRLTVAARTAAVGGDIQYGLDEFGRQITMYNGLPILIADKDNTNTAILPFTEANPGGGTAASTSIYCISTLDGMVTGIQNGEIDVKDLGELQTAPAYRTRIEWYVGMTIYNGKAAARLRGIKDDVVTV
jgi:hypothetical protein